MAHEFTMPKLGLTMTDGTIREWLVADGSTCTARKRNETPFKLPVL
jgi:pyruvate/2-oxoglutarate dehydrogenase complex dihydrolipoamide acyltransferase (E2) component